MMDYKDFMDYIKVHILEYLPERFADSKVEIVSVLKNNRMELDGILIEDKDSSITPNIYLNSFFEDYELGRDMKHIMEAISSIRINSVPEQDIDVSQVLDFQQIKDHIICKLINKEENEQLLADKPYTVMEDLAVTYHILLDWKVDGGSASIPIQDRMMETYGIDVLELHKIALKNTKMLFPAKLSSMEDIMQEMYLSDFMDEHSLEENEARDILDKMFQSTGEMNLYVLTNDENCNGAVAILDTDILKEISEKMGGDFYVLPSSIHEVLIVAKTDVTDYKELEAMVRSVNATEVSPDEVLSDKVYEYDSKEHKLFRSDKVAERKAKLSQAHAKTPIKEKLSAMKEKADILEQSKAGSMVKEKSQEVAL